MAAQVLGTFTQNIIGMMLNSGQGVWIFKENHPCSHRHIELLMRIYGDGIGPFYTTQQITMGIGKEGRATPGRINVKMATNLSGEISHLLQRVNVTSLCGAGNTDQSQNAYILLLQLVIFLTQTVHINTVIDIRIDKNQLFA